MSSLIISFIWKKSGRTFVINYIFILQKEVQDLEVELTVTKTSDQYYSEQVEELKTKLEEEKYVFHISIYSLIPKFYDKNSFLFISMGLKLSFIPKDKNESQAWRCTNVILALWKLKQENYEFKVWALS